MNRDDLLVSIRRTLVPIIVGVAGMSFLSPHVDLGALESVLSGIISAVYYLVLRVGEARIPQLGRLLGAMKQPVYVSPEV